MASAKQLSAAIDRIAWNTEDQYAEITGARQRLDRRMAYVARLRWGVPLHEWAEARQRGSDAVRQLRGSYDPGNATGMLASGLTPRCPPWATRRYRDAAMATAPGEIAMLLERYGIGRQPGPTQAEWGAAAAEGPASLTALLAQHGWPKRPAPASH